MKDIDLRSYFAAHAPSQPESWFEFSYSTPMPKLREGARWCEGCKAGADCEENANCDEMEAHNIEVAEWKRERDKANSVAWRWAWADAMLEGVYSPAA